MRRVRKPLRFPHVMDESATKWMYKFFHKNAWRLPDWLEWEDLVKIGEEAWYEGRRRYPTAVDRPHVMRLFQLILFTKITILSNKRSLQVQEDAEAFELASMVYSIDDHNAPVEYALDAVPIRFRRLLMRLISEGEGLVPSVEPKPVEPGKPQSSLFAPYERLGGGRESLNDRLCRIGELPYGTPVIETLKTYLSPPRLSTRTTVKFKPPTGAIKDRLQKLGCSPQQIERHIRNLRTAPRHRVV